ncbi:hypothetical protein F1D05_17385 [Kribbella qitaiheensis]|uniref:Uncharacterized protein n=1 Tax=Kribbella qitaiheensis TaxID=1544730 RepID=A0A7G6WZE9_9ACTN|nr:hypothetical protein [Kribbella qitaiheensis]QNE19364.1 hypothetical protein F1D05_17385 [Kribbella qitaiheensis]
MTAQHNQPQDPLATQPVDEPIDPIGPITLPSRGRLGLRALALVGTASALAVGVIEIVDGCGTFTSISAPH